MDNKLQSVFDLAFQSLRTIDEAQQIRAIMGKLDYAFRDLEIAGDFDSKDKMLAEFNTAFKEAMSRVGKEEIAKFFELEQEETKKFLESGEGKTFINALNSK